MRSGLWFTVGAAAGVYGVVRVRRLAEAFTPDGMRDRIGAAFVGARMFRDEVARGQAEAEIHLRQRFDGADAGPPRLSAPDDGTRRQLATRTTTTADPAAPDTEEGSTR